MLVAAMMLGLLLAGVILVGGGAWLRRSARSLAREADTRFPRDRNGVIIGAEAIDMPGAAPDAPAVLLLHGGGDTPQTLRYLAEHLHQRGYSVRAPLLPGHGRSIRDFAHVSADLWSSAARAEYQQLRERHGWVSLVGLSMGGALAVQLAAELPELPALVLLAPYVSIPWPIALGARLARVWGIAIPFVRSTGAGSAPSIQNDEERSRSLAYGIFTPAALRALRETVRRARAALPRVQAPTLMIQSRRDNRISVHAGERTFELLGASEKRLVWLDDAGHVITVDRGREHVFELLTEWLEGHRQRRQAIA